MSTTATSDRGGFAALARREPAALAARLEALLGDRLGAPIKVAIAAGDADAGTDAERALGRAALAVALAAADRAGDVPTAWPCPHASLSHSGGVAIAVAAARGARVRGLGVDVELDRPLRPGTARVFCDARERAWLDGLPADTRDAAVLQLWTAKEALYKADPAQGDGIVADYAVRVPDLARGRRPGGGAARLISLRTGDAALSVALRDEEDDRVEATW